MDVVGVSDDGELLSVVNVRWGRGDLRLLFGMVVFYAAGAGAVVVSELLRGPSALIIAAATAVLLAAARTAWRIGSVLRQPTARISLLRSGAVEIAHPLVVSTIRIAGEDVHSMWAGPFTPPAPTRSDRWIGPLPFPANVLDMSNVWKSSKEHADSVVVAFARPLVIQPRLLVSPWLMLLHRISTPFVVGRAFHGLLARVDGDARTATAHLTGRTVRTEDQMPPDVWRWLAQ